MSNIKTLSITNKISVNSIIFSWTNSLTNGEKAVSLLLEVRDISLPWNDKTTLRKELSSVYAKRQTIIRNLPLKKNLEARLTLRTNTNRTVVSNIVSFDTLVAPSTPTDVFGFVVNSFHINVSWNVDDDGGSPLALFYVDYSIDGGANWYTKLVNALDAATTVSATLFSTTLSFASSTAANNSFIFRVKAQNVARLTSEVSKNSLPVDVRATNGANMLFDKSSFSFVSSPWKERLIFAAEQWEQFIKIYPPYAEAIASRIADYNGIRISAFNITSEPNSDWYARCRIASIASVNFNDAFLNRQVNHFVPRFIEIDINIGHTRTEDAWRETLVHELGHGLGIGIGWTSEFLTEFNKSQELAPVGSPFFAIPTRSNMHSITNYPNLEGQYNFIKNTTNIKNIPLIWQSGIDDTNKLSHFAYEPNPFNETTKSWQSVPEDIMSYGHLVGVERRITGASIGALLDFGYDFANSVIEANENVVLSFDVQTFFLYANSTPIKYFGENVKYIVYDKNPNAVLLWEAVAADTVDGTNKLVWRYYDGTLYTWNLTSNWEYVSIEQAEASPNSPEFNQKEVDFQTDINKDGSIGAGPSDAVYNSTPIVFGKSNRDAKNYGPSDGGSQGCDLQNIEAPRADIVIDVPAPRNIENNLQARRDRATRKRTVDISNIRDKNKITASVRSDNGCESSNSQCSNTTGVQTVAKKWYCQNGDCVELFVTHTENIDGGPYNSLEDCSPNCTPDPTSSILG